jgi:hypothetical protein
MWQTWVSFGADVDRAAASSCRSVPGTANAEAMLTAMPRMTKRAAAAMVWAGPGPGPVPAHTWCGPGADVGEFWGRCAGNVIAGPSARERRLEGGTGWGDEALDADWWTLSDMWASGWTWTLYANGGWAKERLVVDVEGMAVTAMATRRRTW